MLRRTLAGLTLTIVTTLCNPAWAQMPEQQPQAIPTPYYVPVPYPVYYYIPVVQPPPQYLSIGPLRYDRNPLDLSPVPTSVVASSGPVVHQTGYRGPKQEVKKPEQPRAFSKKVGGFIFK